MHVSALSIFLPLFSRATHTSLQSWYLSTCVTSEQTLPSDTPLLLPFWTLLYMRQLLGIKATATSTRRSRIMVFFLSRDRKEKSFEAVVLEEPVQTEAGRGLVFALLFLHLLPLLSEDKKGDLLQLIYKGPGWASATERNNYSQLLPICPTVSNATLSGWRQHSHSDGHQHDHKFVGPHTFQASQAS